MKYMTVNKIKKQQPVMTASFKTFTMFQEEMQRWPVWEFLDGHVRNGFTYVDVYDEASFHRGFIGIEEECLTEVINFFTPKEEE